MERILRNTNLEDFCSCQFKNDELHCINELQLIMKAFLSTCNALRYAYQAAGKISKICFNLLA